MHTLRNLLLLAAFASSHAVLEIGNSSDLIALNTPEGTAKLAAQPASSLVWSLLTHFETQITQSFCSVATTATMLNALGVMPMPVDPIYAPYSYFTQANVLGECAEAEASHAEGSTLTAGFIATHGATLHEWQTYLKCRAPTTHVHASTSDAETFRAAALAALSATNPRQAVGINFYRKALHEVGGGHMSPIGAYDAETDRFLLLDVSRYKYPPVWVATAALFDAMNSTDGTAGKSRGWVIVNASSSDAGSAPPPPPPMSDEDRHRRWTDIGACVGALEEQTDAHGVFACFAHPQRGAEVRVTIAMAAALCIVAMALGCFGVCLIQRLRAPKTRKHVELQPAALATPPPAAQRAAVA